MALRNPELHARNDDDDDRREGAISVGFVRPSVCPSGAYIIRERKGLACPNLDGRFPTLDATRIPVSRSNGQRSGLEAGGGIPCRPNPAATLLVLNVSVCVDNHKSDSEDMSCSGWL